MKILVAIASYGNQHDHYLAALLKQFRSMPHEIDFVVLSNIPKVLGPDAEVVVGLPTADPWSLPFGHKKIFAERVNNYDLFIYSEDDHLITERNIQAFMEATHLLPADKIAGFLVYEKGESASLNFCGVHSQYHWDPNSVESWSGRIFAHFTNEHSAFYMLTRAQLQRAIDSGGFLVEPHEGKYDLLCSAATDPYTRCGFKKVVGISDLSDFIVWHMPNKYVGKVGTLGSDVERQVAALREIETGERPRSELLLTETPLPKGKFSKSYYEPSSSEILRLIPSGAKTLLSLGCGWGVLEASVKQTGIQVVALPLDSVISASAEARGVETVWGELTTIPERLAARRFDCLLISNILHLANDPVQVISLFKDLLSSGASVIAVVPSISKLRNQARRIRGNGSLETLGDYSKSGVHLTSHGILRKWFHMSGMKLETIVDVVAPESQRIGRMTFSLANPLLASEFVVRAKNAD